MRILVKLNPNQGINLGPNFTLTANVGTLSPATATLTQLLAGVSVLADDGVSQVTVTSQGVCTNSLILSVLQPTTTTTSTSSSTTTSTTTAAPVVCYNYFIYANDGTEDRTPYEYSYISCAGTIVTGERLSGGPGTTVCAREDSVTGDPEIYVDLISPCSNATTTTTTTLAAFISLGTSGVCSDDPCFNAGTTSWPCSGRVAVNLTNPPSPYTINISYTNGNSGGLSYANVVYVGGLPYVNLSFDSSGSGLTVTVSLLNGSGVVMATSTAQTYSASAATFNSGLPGCPPIS